MNEKTRQGLVIAVILILLIAVAALTGQASKSRTTSQVTPSAEVQSITYKGEEGKTVLELLERDHAVEKQDTQYGTYVRSIDGVAQSENSVWMPYINGELLSESVEKVRTTPDQTISWRYETF